MTTFYTVTGNPPNQTRGISSSVRSEFALIAAGFVSANGDITAKGAIAGQVWTGNHDFSGASYVRGPTPVAASDLVTKSYADNLAISAVVPAQALGFLKSTGTVASFGVTHTGYAQNEVKGTDIASAATINLTTATGNFAHVTGTTPITAITIPIGAERTVVFDGALTLTHGAGLLLPSAANITTAANDRAIIRGDTAGAIVTSYTRADGNSVKGMGTLLATLTPTAAANVDFLTTFTSSYDNYLIVGDGITVGTNDSLKLRVANAGVVDTGSNYSNGTINTSSAASTSISIVGAGSVLAAGTGICFDILVKNANDATKIKGITSNCNYQDAVTPTWNAGFNPASYFSTAAISGLRLYWSGGANFGATGKIRVYGYNNT